MSISNPVRPESSHLGKSFQFKGDISGTEDIYIDGVVEGTIQLPNQVVTIGPNGSVNAEILARELVVHGKITGNVKAQDRVEVTRSGSVQGDLAMARISIQDGAFIQGRVDVCVAGNLTAQPSLPEAAPPEPAPVAATAAAPAAGAHLQGRLLDRHV